jgi:hypothetical protein
LRDAWATCGWVSRRQLIAAGLSTRDRRRCCLRRGSKMTARTMPASYGYVGMSHVTFTGKTLNGAPVDMAIDNAPVVWHSDHGNHEFRAATCSSRRLRPVPSALRTRSTLSEGRHRSCCRNLCQSNHWRPRLPAGDQGRSNYEGNLSPGADRQAMLGEIKRPLPPGNLRFVRHLVDREREILVETHIPRA